MAAHQVKAKQNKAKKPVAVTKAKGAKPKVLHKSGSLPKRKPSVAMKPLAATRPLAATSKPAGQTQAVEKTRPLVKAQVKPVPRHDAKPQSGKGQAPDKGKSQAKLPLKGKAAQQETAAPKPTQSAKLIA